MELTVITRPATGEVFQSVNLDGRWTGFMLRREEPLPDQDVIERYRASKIVWQDVMDYSGNFSFGDINLIAMRELGGVMIICESPYDDDDDYEGDMENTLRVVKMGYDRTKVHEGFTHPLTVSS